MLISRRAVRTCIALRFLLFIKFCARLTIADDTAKIILMDYKVYKAAILREAAAKYRTKKLFKNLLRCCMNEEYEK